MLGCGLLWSTIAWGFADEVVHPFNIADCSGTVRDGMGFVRLHWASIQPQQGTFEPKLEEPFYVQLQLRVDSRVCPRGSTGKYELELPEGMEVANTHKPQCLAGNFGSTPTQPVTCRPLEPLSSNPDRAWRISFFDDLPGGWGVEKGKSAMVRVPVVLRKPLANATLKIKFLDGEVFPDVQFNIPLTVGRVFWDLQAFEKEHSIGHDSAKIPVRLYNWRHEGVVSATLFDKTRNTAFPEETLLSRISTVVQNPNTTLHLPVTWSNDELQPETHYCLKMKFFTTGASATPYESNELCFHTNPLPVYTFTFHPPNSAHGSVDISPLQKEYLHGTEITLTATPRPGWHLASWTVNQEHREPHNPLRLRIDKNLEVLPNFSLELAPYKVGHNPNVAPQSGGCSQGPHKPSGGSLVVLGLLALLLGRRLRPATCPSRC